MCSNAALFLITFKKNNKIHTQLLNNEQKQ